MAVLVLTLERKAQKDENSSETQGQQDSRLTASTRFCPSFVLLLSRLSLSKGKDPPTPKTRFSISTLLRTPGRFTTRPLPVYFTTKMSVVRPFSVLSKDEIGP